MIVYLEELFNQGNLFSKAEFRSVFFTWDSITKFVLMYLKLRSGLPVIIQGGTGIGKTHMIQTLAALMSVQFSKLLVHQGVTE
jgi:ABC-type transport system involved in cytochrome c biogenesis ATPase subunit